ncbi:MAG TPA: TIGR03086 family metal-binding protein [Acidimicrobiales bacterium]|nr:TIGR03086 family metal-binding protein [Acidimicrobiales bacterium]
MADVVALFTRAVDQFGPRVAVIGDRWHDPTPDTEWDVRSLVNHVIAEDLWAPPLLHGMTIAEVGDRFDGDQLGDDPEAAWAAAASASVAAVAEDGALDRTVHVSFGDISGREYVSQLTCDHLIHGWDLARAIGADERLDPELVDWAYDFLSPQVDGWRSAGVFGPQVDVPAGASRQDRLLALTGRSP